MVFQGITNRLYTGYDAVATAGKSLARTAHCASAALSTNLTNENPVHSRALEVAEAVLDLDPETKLSTYLNDHSLLMNEDAIAKLLEDLLTDLGTPHGTLNHSAVILNNEALIERLIDLSQGFHNEGEETVSAELRNASKTILVELIKTSSKRAGLFSQGCPEYISDLISFSHSNTHDGAEIKRFTAVTKLLKELATKNKGLSLSDTSLEFIDKLPKYFHGSVGTAFQDFFQETINAFLSDPMQILENEDLLTEPQVLSEYYNALGDLFESSIPKPFRKDTLVQATKSLIESYELGDRPDTIGIETARRSFIDTWLNKKNEILALENEVIRLNELKQDIRTSIEYQSEISIDREFCSMTQVGSQTSTPIITVASAPNLQSIEQRIHQISKQKLELEEKLSSSFTAIESAFERTKSPFNENGNGLKDLFFSRLFGKDEEGSDIDSKGFIGLLTKGDDVTTNLEIDFNKLSDPVYGKDSSGFKKLAIDFLKARYQKVQATINTTSANLAAIQPRVRELEVNFWSPLKAIFPQNGNLLRTRDGLKNTLTAYCMNEELIDRVIVKSEAQKKNLVDILKILIVKDPNDHQYSVNMDILGSMGLSNINERIVASTLRSLSNELNKSPNAQFEDLLDGGKPTDYRRRISSMMDKLRPIFNGLSLNAGDRDFDRLKLCFNNESILYGEFLQAVARTIDYERKAPGSAQAKITKIEAALGVQPGTISVLFTDELSKNIKDSTFISEREKKLKAQLELNNILNDPNHPDYHEAWSKELRSSNLSSFYGSNIKRDLFDMGLDEKNAMVLINKAQEFSDIYFINDSDTDSSFIDLIRDIIKSIVSLLGIEQAGEKNA
jgi:hypothetical protein